MKGLHYPDFEAAPDRAMRFKADATLALAALATLAIPARAALVWDEAASGDLSGTTTAPTRLVFRAGSNVIAGGVQHPVDTQDYMQFTVLPGQELSALRLLSYDDPATPPGEDGNRGYHAILAGTLGLVPTPANRSAFLGGNHLDPVAPGSDLLPLLGGEGRLAGVGFSGALGAGDYVYLVQQTGPQLSAYRLDFVLTPVPVPAALWLALPAWLSLAGCRRAAPRLA
jgi:hypothetical protein